MKTELALAVIAEKVADHLMEAEPDEARRIYENLSEANIRLVDHNLALVLNGAVVCVVDLPQESR